MKMFSDKSLLKKIGRVMIYIVGAWLIFSFVVISFAGVIQGFNVLFGYPLFNFKLVIQALPYFIGVTSLGGFVFFVIKMCEGE